MKLNKEFLIDLHNEKILNKNEYIKKILLVELMEVWDDFTAIKWISEYFKNPINVCNVCNGRILSTFGLESNTKIMHIAFDHKRKHFEPIKTILD